MTPRRWTIAVVGLVFLASFAGTCGQTEEAKKGGQTVSGEQTAVQTGFGRLSNSQPVPVFDYSQERQTVIDVERARAEGAISTTRGYLEGVGLEWWCPSVGAPVPSTYQLSGSTQWVDLPGDQTRERFETEQGEPTGIYVGESTGTWTLCLDDNGKKFAVYWEGYVKSTIGKVAGLDPAKRERLSESTFTFQDKPR